MAEHAVTTGEATATVEQHSGGHEAEPTVLGLGAPWFVAAAMVAVILIIVWKKVPSAIGHALDKRIDSIRSQLAEAAQLRREAEALRAEYEAKAAAADAERQTLLDRARQEAQAIVDQAKADTASLIERRSRLAEDKIAAAERQAIDEVRNRAAAAAAAAAAKLIGEELGADADKAMVDKTIAEIGKA
jgi:F-type H+-transporting ATPase subunit b